MFVLIQFPIADGRVFAGDTGMVTRPDWEGPEINAVVAYREFVRGFGRLAYRPQEANAAWIDEDYFAYARRAVRFPTLDHRHFRASNGTMWMVSCRFRRLFADGRGTVRLEIGFEITPDEVPADEVVRELLALPATVPGAWEGDNPKDLILLGPHLARRYARATTRHRTDPAIALVAECDPVVIVDMAPWYRVRPADAADASAASRQGAPLYVSATHTRHGKIKTWYLDGSHGPATRNVRLVLLRQHAQEQTLDRILRWTSVGALEYQPRTPAGDRLENYINDATGIVDGANERGIDLGPLRDALDAVTATQRTTIPALRRKRLDGMRRQVRLKAEQAMADHLAQQITFTFNEGGTVVMGDQNFSGTFYGPVANTVWAQTLENSFNTFVESEPDDKVKELVSQHYQQVDPLLAKLKEDSPEEADDMAGAVASFTEEVAKKTPSKITLRAIGSGIVGVAKKLATVGEPIIVTVAALLKLFGISPI